MPQNVPDAQRMQCMEVWGGNQPVDHGVMMAGLDAWLYSRPFGEAEGGGDVHYVSSCASGRITRLLLADVSGHGQAVSTTAAALRKLMFQNVNYLDQTRFVRAMNHQFAELSENRWFATAVVTTFFAPTNDLSVCNAGHPPPLHYSSATKQWSFLEGQAAPVRKRSGRRIGAQRAVHPENDSHPDEDPRSDELANIPLGVLDLASYDQFGVRLRVGDLVLCYTDALMEARGRDGRQLGLDGLLRVVRDVKVSEADSFIPALLGALSAATGDDLGDDDVTVLLFRPNGLAPRMPLKDRLKASTRMLGAVLGATRRHGRPVPWPELSLPNIGGAMFHPLNYLWGRRNRGRGVVGSEGVRQ